MPRSKRCRSCPVHTTRRMQCAQEPSLMQPLFGGDAPSSSLESTQAARHERLLREAIAPYLCLDELRQLAARGEDVQVALARGSIQPVPEEIQALLNLLALFLKPRSDQTISRCADLAGLLMLEMGYLDHEEFWITCLDVKNHVQRIHALYRGSLQSIVVRVAEVFRLPLLLNSASIIVAHNHPSGDPSASPEDVQVTHTLLEAGKWLDIEVVDHLIIGRGRWISMREQRLGGW